MPPSRVILLRMAALVSCGVAGVAAPASASTGGAKLPAGIQPSASAPAAPSSSADLPSATAGDATASSAPATTTGSTDASTSSIAPPLPALPVLATAARRSDDPVTQDLAALIAPTPIAAIDGHVVVVRPRGALSELVDLGDPGNPRVLLASTRVFGTPLAGRDATGRAVVVVSPCSGSPATATQGQTPRCPLRSIDLLTGQSVALPSTTGALAGDLSGTHLVFTRTSPQTGVRLYASAGGAAAQAVPLPKLTPAGLTVTASTKPIAGSVRAPAFDVDDAGRIAVVLEYSARSPNSSSTLWMRSAAGAWVRATTIATGFTGLGTRHVLGPRLDATGVSAYVEGVVEAPSYLGHWSDDGASSSQLSVRRSIGRATILDSTAFDSGRLLFVDWMPGAPCGSEGALACGLRSVGPVSAQ